MICKQLGLCIEDKNKACRTETDCIEFTDKRTSVKCEEKRKKYCLNNDRGARIRKYHVDNGIVKNEREQWACDNLLAVYDGDQTGMIFVELKGTDFKHAVEQTYETIVRFLPELKHKKLYGRIVHTQGVPRLGNSGPIVDLERLLRKNGGNLKMHEWILNEDVSRLDEKRDTKKRE
ncbi:MAG: hypothetical protein HFI35_15750 [Roseburia sp.]|jgi:hypothetical protein|nr:hypothetical protein [Roseburia sp.]